MSNKVIDLIDLKASFRTLYEGEPRVFRAPGRANLIGEHTDYNDGFVMPAAIHLSTWVAIGPRMDRRLVVHSESFSETFEFDLDQNNPRAHGHWSDYPIGVAVTLERAGHMLRGANLLLRGDVPAGAGLSSSAALEVATGFALLANSGLQIDRLELARICQRAESEFVGMRCGLMDQFIACHGEEGKVLLLDCRSLDYEPLPLPEGARLVIFNTMVKHQLAAREYNRRRTECEAGVQILARVRPEIRALRDVSPAELESRRPELPAEVFRRCRHVVGENLRVLEARSALVRFDIPRLGELMHESHLSLANDYEVSCPELDLMVELARREDGVYGARMTGGGFGGSTINLVQSEVCAKVAASVSSHYEAATALRPEVYICRTASGVGEVSDSLQDH